MHARMDQGYLIWLDSAPLAAASRHTYTSRLAAFLDWLLEVQGKTYDRLTKRDDFVSAAYWYRQYLTMNGATDNTVNTSMTAIDKYMTFKALPNLKHRRSKTKDVSPKALTADELARYLFAVEHLFRIEKSTSVRNKALVLLLVHTGLRISEIAALKVSDVSVSRRRGTVLVRSGKGMRRREVPLNASIRNLLLEYLPLHRANLARRRDAALDDGNQPLWLGQRGQAIGIRNIDLIVRKIGARVGLVVSAHILRHTFLTRAVRTGIDLVTVADWAGHSRLETTRRYTQPTAEEKAVQIEKLNLNCVATNGPPRLVERPRKRMRAS